MPVGGELGCSRGNILKDINHPIGKRWIHAIVDPLTLSAVGHQLRVPQLGQVARHIRLGHANRVGEFADAQLLMREQQ